MIRTLRGRFVLSHVLPSLVIVPLMGIALIYGLESQVLLPNLARALAGQAVLVADLAREQPEVWTDAARAQAFVDRMAQRLDSRLMLVDPAGRLLASSDPRDRSRLGRVLDLPDLPDALAGRIRTHTARSQRLDAEVADALVPVIRPGHPIDGAVRLSLRLDNVTEEFLRLRYLIGGILAAGILLGGAVGWMLALNLERPLKEVTQAVSDLARGREWMSPGAQSPEEIGLLVRSFDTLVERLRGLEEARRHLLANLVHELGRPLGALASAAQALRSGAADDAALRDELLAGMEEELRRLERLLEDLAQLHDRILGALELHLGPTDIGEWLARVLVPWREAAHRKGLQWEAAVPSDLPRVDLDPDRMVQALGNLLSNAIKYTAPGGTVSVEAGLRDESLWIRVGDTGPGITPDEQTRIFEPFYRGQTSRRFPQGMGLGLAIARDLATAHGGRLAVDSTPGEGSRFTLWIPTGRARAAKGPTG